MKKQKYSNFILITLTGVLVSCGDISKQAEEKINQLNDKTEKLDSLVNKELQKVNSLDSIINKEGAKVKKLDSLITKSTSKIDSIANSKMNLLKKMNHN
jgi:hypothetical protein